MAFASVIGQDRIKKNLWNAINNKRLSHAYLLSGPEGAGCEALAIAFANYLLNQENPDASEDHRIRNLSHPDVHLIFPSPAKAKEEEYQEILQSLVVNPYLRLQPWANPSISIEKIREIKRKSSFKSFEGKGKVFIILDCERMTIEASNSLLKVLEEPSDKTYLLMTSSKPNLLLPTITSRCQMIKLDPLSAEEIESALKKQTDNEDSKIKLAARLASGSFRQALELLNEDLDNWQQQALDLFRKTVQNQYLQVIYIDELLNKYNRDLKNIKVLLAHLLLWFRDALIYRETNGDSNLIIHLNQIEVLQNFNKRFPGADLDNACREIENSIALMERNVQINLILIVLLNKLRVYIGGNHDN